MHRVRRRKTDRVPANYLLSFIHKGSCILGCRVGSEYPSPDAGMFLLVSAEEQLAYSSRTPDYYSGTLVVCVSVLPAKDLPIVQYSFDKNAPRRCDV